MKGDPASEASLRAGTGYGGPSLFGSFQAWALAEHMADLASRLGVKPPRRGDAMCDATNGGLFPLSLAATGACAECGRTLVSAVHGLENRVPRHMLCGRCQPFSNDGNVDHAEWLKTRRAA